LSEGAAKPAFELLLIVAQKPHINCQSIKLNSQPTNVGQNVCNMLYRRHERSAKRRISSCECSKSIPSRIDHAKPSANWRCDPKNAYGYALRTKAFYSYYPIYS